MREASREYKLKFTPALLTVAPKDSYTPTLEHTRHLDWLVVERLLRQVGQQYWFRGTVKLSRRTDRLRLWCRVHDYFVAAIDLRKSVTLYAKNASPIPPTIAKLRHTASSPPPR